MIGSVGNRLRLVLRQPESATPAPPLEPPIPEVEFVAYAEDGRLSGSIRLDASRLSDMLNSHDEYLLVDVRAERIPDGKPMIVPEILVRREELLLIHATGPRGERERRLRTIPRAVSIQTGPFLVTGDIHASAGMDTLNYFRRRRPMVPLTDACIQYSTASGPVTEYVDAIVVNRDLIAWVRVGKSGAVARDQIDITTPDVGNRIA
ncbi:MAG: hypothetical protein ABI573_07215 [Chloroflexota bacterium]